MSVEALAAAVLENLKSISQAETVIGKPIQTGSKTIVPVSKVSMGFGLAGNKSKLELSASGGGIQVEPIAFLVVSDDEVKLLPVNKEGGVLGKVVDMIPDIVDKFTKDSGEGLSRKDD